MDWTEFGRWQPTPSSISRRGSRCWVSPARRAALRNRKARATTLGLIPHVLNDLSGVAREVLTDRDPALVIGETSGQAGGLRIRVGRPGAVAGDHAQGMPYLSRQDQTKGKVARVIREIKEDFLRG